MIMFLDEAIDAKRIVLASKLSIAIVVEAGGEYRLLNPGRHPS
jgi:hypothetical protein